MKGIGIEQAKKVLSHITLVCEGCAHIPLGQARALQQHVGCDLGTYQAKWKKKPADTATYLLATQTINLVDPVHEHMPPPLLQEVVVDPDGAAEICWHNPSCVPHSLFSGLRATRWSGKCSRLS